MSKIKAIVATVLTLSTLGFSLAAHAQSAGDSVLIQRNTQGSTITGNNNTVRNRSVTEFLGQRFGSVGNDGVNQESTQLSDVQGSGNLLEQFNEIRGSFTRR